MFTTDEGITITADMVRQSWLELLEEKRLFYEERECSGIETKLFIGNLHPTTNEEELRNTFGKFGPIKDCIILRHNDNSSKCSGFVKFYYSVNAMEAIEQLNNRCMDKSQTLFLVVQLAKSKTSPPTNIVINTPSNISSNSRNSTIGSPYFVHQQPNPAIVYPSLSHHFSSQSPLSVSNVSEGHMNGNYPILNSGHPAFSNCGTTNLYINNLRIDATEEHVRMLFKPYGDIVSIKLFSGYGFISYNSTMSALTAISQLNGAKHPIVVDGKHLEVSLKTMKSKNNSSNRNTVDIRHEPNSAMTVHPAEYYCEPL